MKTFFSRRWSFIYAVLAIFGSASTFAQSTGVEAASGLWAYEKLQGGGKGEFLPLTGVILFKDGVLLQQSIFDGEPFAKQVAMAHAGSYKAAPPGVHMITEQTISIAPDKPKPLSFRRAMPHDITAERSGDALKIVFDSGTVQTFKRIGPADGEIYSLANGALAFVDGYFVLVAGDEKSVVSGFGKYTRKGKAYDLQVIRWAEATDTKAVNQRDVKLAATFDGKTFALPDGRKFTVVAPAK